MNYFPFRSTYFVLLISLSLSVIGSQQINSQASFISRRTNSQDSQATELYFTGQDYESDSENTPLHKIASIRIARKILRTGANPNAFNKYGQTPLHTAIDLNRIKLALLLVRHGASITALDNNGKTPLEYLRYNSIPGNQQEYFENPEAYYIPERKKEEFKTAANQYKIKDSAKLNSLTFKRLLSINQEGDSSQKKAKK